VSRLDRVFILPYGLPGRPEWQHAVLSPSLYDSYDASFFPGLTDLLTEIHELQNQGEDASRPIRELRKHVSDLRIAVKQAGDYMHDVWKVL